jgi:hypothetical protein
VVLLHLAQLIPFLDEFIEHLVLVLDLVLSEYHHIQALALIREVCAKLFDLQAVLLDASLDRIQLPLLLDEDLIGWVAVYVQSLFPFFLLHHMRLAYETLEFL